VSNIASHPHVRLVIFLMQPHVMILLCHFLLQWSKGALDSVMECYTRPREHGHSEVIKGNHKQACDTAMKIEVHKFIDTIAPVSLKLCQVRGRSESTVLWSGSRGRRLPHPPRQAHCQFLQVFEQLGRGTVDCDSVICRPVWRSNAYTP
jgi:hypothetical protein